MAESRVCCMYNQ